MTLLGDRFFTEVIKVEEVISAGSEPTRLAGSDGHGEVEMSTLSADTARACVNEQLIRREKTLTCQKQVCKHGKTSANVKEGINFLLSQV